MLGAYITHPDCAHHDMGAGRRNAPSGLPPFMTDC